MHFCCREDLYQAERKNRESISPSNPYPASSVRSTRTHKLDVLILSRLDLHFYAHCSMVYLWISRPALLESLRRYRSKHPDTHYDILGIGMAFSIPKPLQIAQTIKIGCVELL